MIHLGVATEADRAALQATIALFEDSLLALQTGDDANGIIMAPSTSIQLGLSFVSGLWGEIAPDFMDAADGAPVSAAQLEYVASRIDELLSAMNETVMLYEAI